MILHLFHLVIQHKGNTPILKFLMAYQKTQKNKKTRRLRKTTKNNQTKLNSLSNEIRDEKKKEKKIYDLDISVRIKRVFSISRIFTTI